MAQTLTLPNYAGQHNDVEIHERENGSMYVTFKMKDGYGYPSLEQSELKSLLKKMKMLSED